MDWRLAQTPPDEDGKVRVDPVERKQLRGTKGVPMAWGKEVPEQAGSKTRKYRFQELETAGVASVKPRAGVTCETLLNPQGKESCPWVHSRSGVSSGQ